VRVHILGRGKVGRALARDARAADLSVRISSGRQPVIRATRDATLFIVAVPDARIREVSERIATHLRIGDVVIHCSGSRGPEELGACAEHGAHIACVHPMLSFASARPSPALRESVWVARGDKRAISAAKKLARALGAHCIEGPSGSAEYHAAAAILANTSAALTLLFVQILEPLGVPQKQAERAAAGMLHSVASNVASVGVPAALTGPIRRGDVDTVKMHIEALARRDPKLARSYQDLSKLTLACAREAGLTLDSARRIARLLERDAKVRYKGKPAPKRRR